MKKRLISLTTATLLFSSGCVATPIAESVANDGVVSDENNVETSTSVDSSNTITIDTNQGLTIPSINYHVDNMVLDGDQAEIDKENSGTYYTVDASYYIDSITKEYVSDCLEIGMSDENLTFVQEELIVAMDHAYQGLNQLPSRLKRGAIAYLNGEQFVYSGWSKHRKHKEGDVKDSEEASELAGSKKYRLLIRTCADDEYNYICYFY